MTQGRVMKRPASFGQHCRMGKSSKENSSRLMTSLQGPVATVLGKNLPISASMGSIFTLSRNPWGDFTSMKPRMRSAISSRESTSSASFMRRAEPNWLISTCAPGYPLTFWKRSARPPGTAALVSAGGPGTTVAGRGLLRPKPLLTRSVISLISRMGSTSVRIFFNSPARSSAAIHSRRSS